MFAGKQQLPGRRVSENGSLTGAARRPSSSGAQLRTQASQQPSNFQELSEAPLAAAMPNVLSAHPDAVRRRQQALARKASAQVEAERAQSREWWEGRTPANLMSAATPEAFEAAVATGGLVVVDFFTPWCNACRRLFPAICKVAENNPDVLFLKVNGGDSALGKFVESLSVDKLPYFHFYHDGSLQAHFAANLTKINLLRAEICALKECKEPSCVLPEF